MSEPTSLDTRGERPSIAGHGVSSNLAPSRAAATTVPLLPQHQEQSPAVEGQASLRTLEMKLDASIRKNPPVDCPPKVPGRGLCGRNKINALEADAGGCTEAFSPSPCPPPYAQKSVGNEQQLGDMRSDDLFLPHGEESGPANIDTALVVTKRTSSAYSTKTRIDDEEADVVAEGTDTSLDRRVEGTTHYETWVQAPLVDENTNQTFHKSNQAATGRSNDVPNHQSTNDSKNTIYKDPKKTKAAVTNTRPNGPGAMHVPAGRAKRKARKGNTRSTAGAAATPRPNGNAVGMTQLRGLRNNSKAKSTGESSTRKEGPKQGGPRSGKPNSKADSPVPAEERQRISGEEPVVPNANSRGFTRGLRLTPEEREAKHNAMKSNNSDTKPTSSSGILAKSSHGRLAGNNQECTDGPESFPTNEEEHHVEEEEIVVQGNTGHQGSWASRCAEDTEQQGKKDGESNNVESNLPEATPVEEDCFAPNLEVQPYDVEIAERKRFEITKEDRKYIGGLALALFCIVAGATLGAMLFRHKHKQSGRKAWSPTAVPTIPPSESPSSAPSGALDLLVEVLPERTRESLNRYGTPQWKALDWLENHPNVSHLEEWRKTQLFALGTFYYNFENVKWKDHIRGEWLDVTRDECNWYTTQQGTYNENGTFVDTICPPNSTSCLGAKGKTSGILPCDQQGHFKSLALSGFLKRDTPNNVTLPLELTLLPRLRRLGLNSNRISASLVDFGVHHLTQLESFQIQKNKLTGTIPSQIGLMSNLKFGLLHTNKLNGVLPSQVGKLPRLEVFRVGANELSGTIPNQIWALDRLKKFHAVANDLSGTISTDIAQLSDTALELKFRGNNLNGTIPSEVGFLCKLLLFDLGNNRFIGSLPTEFGLMKNITKLSLGRNGITGQIPSQLGTLTNLKELFLNGNELTGSVPSELGLLTELESLRLSNNSFIGGGMMIPSQLALLTNLVDYDFEMPEVNGTSVVPLA